MKRSFINKSIEWAKDILSQYGVHLPRFAYWTMDAWRDAADEAESVKRVMLGWDVTDYGLDTFDEIGGVLFTVRNGNIYDREIGTPYAEKYIILKKGQKLPMHMHKTKTEDIISRCGGAFSIRLYGCTPEGLVDETGDVTYFSDGISYTVKAGSVVDITNGNSITLHPGLYHEFWAKDAPAVIGEVSSINDDHNDNFFTDDVARFTTIEEDAAPACPLCNEYNIL